MPWVPSRYSWNRMFSRVFWVVFAVARFLRIGCVYLLVFAACYGLLSTSLFNAASRVLVCLGVDKNKLVVVSSLELQNLFLGLVSCGGVPDAILWGGFDALVVTSFVSIVPKTQYLKFCLFMCIVDSRLWLFFGPLFWLRPKVLPYVVSAIWVFNGLWLLVLRVTGFHQLDASFSDDICFLFRHGLSAADAAPSLSLPVQ